MAFLPVMDMQRFKEILNLLMSNDNEKRRSAENEYYKLSVADKHNYLLNVLNEVSTAQETEIAAVFWRRLVATEFEFYSKMPPEALNQMKNVLLFRIQHEQNDTSLYLRKRISEVAVQLARNSIDENGTNHWQEYLNFLYNGAHSLDPELKEIVLSMFSRGPGVFGNQQAKYINVICQLLSETLAGQQLGDIRYIAVRALTNFMLANEKEVQVQKRLAEAQCDTHLLKFFEENLESKVDPDEVLRCLVDLAEACPNFFRSKIDNLFCLCWKGCSEKEQLDSTRQLCLEVFVTICESAPSMVRKFGQKHIPVLVISTLSMMTELKEIPQWDFDDDASADDDRESNVTVAEAALDRLACALGGKAMLPLLCDAIQELLSSGDWKGKYAGLMAISTIGEGCRRQMTSILPKIVEGVFPFLFDQSNSRVRYAACNALGQMSTDFAPIFQRKLHDKVILPLLQLLGDPSSPRVQAHAGAALYNFFEFCPKSILTPYLNSIVIQLEVVLNFKLNELAEKGTKLVLEQVVVTLASLADCAQEKFIEYYDKFMPCLKFIIQNTNQPHLLHLRGKTIECVSLIGLAVGKEKFLPDASVVMELLFQSQTADTTITDDDPQLPYLISAWARICKILGKGFEPFLRNVMGPVLKAASLKPEITLIDRENMKSAGEDDDEEEWEIVNLGEKRNFGIRTPGLDDKATACQMLVCYAKELKDSFAPYVEDTVQLMIPMLTFYFHEGVRIAAGEILPCLLESAKIRGEKYLQDLWRFILPPLLQALVSELELEVLSKHMTAFGQCIDVLNCDCLTSEDMLSLITILKKHLENHFTRCVERENKRKEEDFDEAAEEEFLKQNDEDYNILYKISEIVGALFRTYKEQFFVCFDMLLPYFIKLLDSNSWQDRQWSLCVFANVIEFTGPACAKYKQFFLEPIMKSLDDPNPNLRQTAAHSVGVLAQHGGNEFIEYCSRRALPSLVKMINILDSRSEENERATESAISSVAKIFMSKNTGLEPERIIPLWISWLPIWEDEVEVNYVFTVLCVLLEMNTPAILGNANCNIPRIVQIFVEAFSKEAIEPSSDVGKRITLLLKDIQKDGGLFSLCLGQLTPDHQMLLQKALSQ